MMKQVLIILLFGLAIFAGCTPASTESNPTPEATDVPPTATVPANQTEPVEDPNPGLNAGEVPQAIFESVLVDLMAVSGATVEELTVNKSEAIIWSDGSLGCPQPDVMYTQALVPGYQIIISIGDKTYDYHVADSGAFVLCGNPLTSGSNEGTPTK